MRDFPNTGGTTDFLWFALFCCGKTERAFCFAKYRKRSIDMKELPKVYDPRDVESRIYKLWMDGDCFKAEPNQQGKTVRRVISCRASSVLTVPLSR